MAEIPDSNPGGDAQPRGVTMSNADYTDKSDEPAADFLTHLEREFGWNDAQAIEVLAAYIMSTEAGRALRRELSRSEDAGVSAARRAPLEAA